MPRVTWDDPGTRFYEAGIDRAMLYVGETPGVPWSGLTAVNESPTGGDAEPFYIDGFKYANLSAAEEFEASIEGFAAPPEFYPCDGSATIGNGLLATSQPRPPFALAYRNLVGNDTRGEAQGYKLHLIYGALAAPASRNYATLTDTPSPMNLSWKIATLPPLSAGIRPTAHFIVATTSSNQDQVAALEDILYGTESSLPAMPTVDQLRAIFA